jgi:hypothetical protein
VRLNLAVTSNGGELSETRKFKVIRPRACSKKGGNGDGQLCGKTDHL